LYVAANPKHNKSFCNSKKQDKKINTEMSSTQIH